MIEFRTAVEHLVLVLGQGAQPTRCEEPRS